MTGRPKKAGTPEDKKATGVKKTDAEEASTPSEQPAASKSAADPADASKPRMVLKTLKRVTAAAPQSPTLRRVTPGAPVRRVIPKAPPKPIPPPPPPPPPEPPKPPVAEVPKPQPAPIPAPEPKVEVKPTVSPEAAKPIAPVAKPATASAAPAPAPVAPAKATPAPAAPKAPTSQEPTATYTMPANAQMPLKGAPVRRTPPPFTRGKGGPSRDREDFKNPVGASASSDAPTAGPRPKVKLPEVLTVKDLAGRLAVKPIDVIKKLLGLGMMVTINQQIDADTAHLAADSLGFDVEIIPILEDPSEQEKVDSPESLKPRPPIVTIMGHVDHGKTSLLDAIRKTRVAEREAGGITQHIGAYRVPTAKGDIVFLDTPGHEAFTAMRSRGAQITDIVVLVVAADDGVMPQTVEAIDHARAAGVKIVVAVNKVDLPTANLERIRRDLSTHQLMPEEWGGKTVFVDVSAKVGTNIEKLLEMLALEAELMELKANPDRSAVGTVIEARLDARRGVTVTLLIQKGTLKIGDIVVAGTSYGRIRALIDDRGNRLEAGTPSTPVEVLGLSSVPQAGDHFTVMSDEREARTLVERRIMVLNEQAQRKRHVTLENLHQTVADGKIKELKVIIKADVQGSVQALRDAVERLSNDEIRLNVIHAGVGGINETDVSLADASDGVIIGFNVRPDAKSDEIARQHQVSVRTYRIIYEAIADIRAAMEGLLSPQTQEIILGHATVRQVFKLSNGLVIAGCMVTDGKFNRGSKARLLRDNVVVFEGAVDSLRRFKDDVREVEKGFECGIGFNNFQDLKPQDVIEVFSVESITRKLEPAS